MVEKVELRFKIFIIISLFSDLFAEVFRNSLSDLSMNRMKLPYFINFKSPVQSFVLPDKFTFPFHYQASEIAQIAASELQDYLQSQTDFEHNFGVDDAVNKPPIGKMFGVLVVKDQGNKLGYIAAFSGKLANSNNHSLFVPPVFDILKKDGFYKQGEELNTQTTAKIDALLVNQEYLDAKAFYPAEVKAIEHELIEKKNHFKEKKIKRREIRILLEKSNDSEFVSSELARLEQESKSDQFELKDFIRQQKARELNAKTHFEKFENELVSLKHERKQRSIGLQAQLFQSYDFLNADLENKSLLELFEKTAEKTPPSGAGECAAPKLLQYAYLNKLQPIALAEFWWGDAPNSQIRKHKQFYPACKSKCLPILSHMLKGLDVEENTLLSDFSTEKEIEVIYEDEVMMAISKPAEFLSVPGKAIEDSVLHRLRQMLPNATGPLLLHRLDMSTSGILLVAKNEEAHTFIQKQFQDRVIKKRYVALLDGLLQESRGEIELPLRVDLDNRPQQMVCFEHGKHAKTRWKTVERIGNKTMVYFYPITGRTHQLRVHAAHKLGLNTPIVGDDLYGSSADRLYLHAESIKFIHPTTNRWMKLKVKCEF